MARVARAAASLEGGPGGTPRDLPALVWLWLPLPALAVAFACGAYARHYYPRGSPESYQALAWYTHWFDDENGIIEIATALALAAALVLGVAALREARGVLGPWCLRWVALVVLSTLYFFGEEVSWGQHLFAWETPEWFRNRQNETNLHNLSSWYNQKPRHLFLLWVVVGGIGVPLFRRLRRVAPPPQNWRYWFWPTRVCLPVALLALIVRLPEWAATATGMKGSDPFFWSITLAPPSESQEYCFGMFLLVYLGSLWWRLRQMPAARPLTAAVATRG